MRAVGGDEVDERRFVLQVLREVDPARVGLELAVAGHVVESRRAALSDGTPVSRPRAMLMVGEVERQAEQVVAQRLGDELVDLVAGWRVMPRTMAPAASFGGQRAVVVERQRVEEGLDQADARSTSKFGSKRSTVSVSIEWPKR